MRGMTQPSKANAVIAATAVAASALAIAAPLLDQNEAAKILGLKNPRTMSAWRLKRCGPPYRKIGKRLVRYSENEIREWAERRDA